MASPELTYYIEPLDKEVNRLISQILFPRFKESDVTHAGLYCEDQKQHNLYLLPKEIVDDPRLLALASDSDFRTQLRFWRRCGSGTIKAWKGPRDRIDDEELVQKLQATPASKRRLMRKLGIQPGEDEQLD